MLDFLIVGSGLTGATIARQLHDAGHTVRVIDRRSHQGGNVHDHLRHGIRVHTYGPHYFRTNNARIWEWVNRYADWHRYEPCLQTKVDGELYPWPPTAEVIKEFDDGWRWEGQPVDFETACLSKMPERIYRLFVEPYTLKQWGTTDLAASLAGRFDVRQNDLRLKDHRHQGVPTDGYAAFTAAILDGIPLNLGTDWLTSCATANHVVYTGPIDELYRYEYGRLAYRGQRREHRWYSGGLRQPCGQINNPGPGAHIRTLEWRHMMPTDEGCNGTILTTETPYTPIDPNAYEYPMPDRANASLYARYKARADADPHLTVCGRLGEYRYYDMDQAIGRALRIAHRLGSGDAGAHGDAA